MAAVMSGKTESHTAGDVRRERRTLTASWEKKKKKKNKSVIVIYDSWERERRYMCPRLNGRDGPLDSTLSPP